MAIIRRIKHRFSLGNVMEQDVQTTHGGRLGALDGIRGWAAFSVVIFHLFYETFGIIHPEFRSPYIHFLMNGHLAVAAFFVLSGQALSMSYIQNRQLSSVDKMVIKRYPRLAIPVFFSCLAVYVLMQLGLTYNTEAGVIVHREDWLGAWLNFNESFPGLLTDALIQVFRNLGVYNEFLWTMEYELIGSFIVFGVLYCYKHIRFPLVLFLSAAIILTVNSPYIACFFYGMAISQIRKYGVFDYLKSKGWWFYASIAIIAAVILFDMMNTKYKFFGYYETIQANTIKAVLLLFVAQSNNLFERAMCSKVSLFMGHISFPLYLIHFPVMVSLMSHGIISANEDGVVSFTEATTVGILTLIFCMLAAWAFTSIDKMTNVVCAQIAKVTALIPRKAV